MVVMGRVGQRLRALTLRSPVFRASVAQSSYPGLKPFCDHFLDAATARGMTGGACSMTGGPRSMTGARSVEFESRNGCRLKVQY